MLRNRPRAVSSKQALMADHSSQTSSSYKKPIPSFFGSPRFKAFNFTTKGLLSETEPINSPTSILDNKLSFPFGYDMKHLKSPKVYKQHPKGLGLAIVETLKDDDEKLNDDGSSCSCQTSNKMVLFGTKLRVHIPPLIQPPSPTTSPTDFGIKTKSRISHVKDSPRVFHGCVPVSEIMELSESEDYTCVITHGPNPKTTHIFDNCVVESYCNEMDKPKSVTENNFLSFCHTCKKNLQQKIDIYIYRGEKAFCSQECRYQEMVLDGEEN